jgi:hypothetical protein
VTEPAFHEVQTLRQWHAWLFMALPPAALLFITIRQVVFHHPWGNKPLSNGGLIFLTVLLLAVYVRLISVRLVTDIRSGELAVGLRGLWRRRHIPLSAVRSVAPVRFDPAAEYGGYGIRRGPRGVAYIAQGNRGVQLELQDGSKLLIGSQRPDDLAQKIKLSRGSVP